MPDEDVVQAVVNPADQEGHPLPLRGVGDAPLHVEALGQVPDGALQHRRVAGAHHQVAVIEADPLQAHGERLGKRSVVKRG